MNPDAPRSIMFPNLSADYVGATIDQLATVGHSIQQIRTELYRLNWTAALTEAGVSHTYTGPDSPDAVAIFRRHATEAMPDLPAPRAGHGGEAPPQGP